MSSFEGRHRRMPPSHAFVTGICKSGKRGYWTRAGAANQAKTMKKETGDKGLHAYDCPFCEYFHVGHMSEAVRQGRVTRRDAYPPKRNRAS